MFKLLHRIAHWLGTNKGDIETRYLGESPGISSSVWVGFRCRTCGELQDWHKASEIRFP